MKQYSKLNPNKHSIPGFRDSNPCRLSQNPGTKSLPGSVNRAGLGYFGRLGYFGALVRTRNIQPPVTTDSQPVSNGSFLSAQHLQTESS